MKNKGGKEEPWKRGKKEMKNKEGKEEPWKRGKKGMNNREGKKGSIPYTNSLKIEIEVW